MKAKVHVVEVFAFALPELTDTDDTDEPDGVIVSGALDAASAVASVVVATVYWLRVKLWGAGGFVTEKAIEPVALAASEHPDARVTTTCPLVLVAVDPAQLAKLPPRVTVGEELTAKFVG